MLFNVFINDIQDFLEKDGDFKKYGIGIEDIVIYMLLYADDIVLIAKSKEGLQCFLDTLFEFCIEKKMKINIKKTQIVVFTKGKNQFLTDFFFNGVKLKQVSFYKYLGNLFYENLSFKPNLEFVVKKSHQSIIFILEVFEQIS